MIEIGFVIVLGYLIAIVIDSLIYDHHFRFVYDHDHLTCLIFVNHFVIDCVIVSPDHHVIGCVSDCVIFDHVIGCDFVIDCAHGLDHHW